MRLKSNIKLRKIGRKHMIVASVDGCVNLTNVFTLNEVAAWLWQKAQEGEFSKETLIAALCSEYDVEESVVRNDVDAMLKQWEQNGWLETSETE